MNIILADYSYYDKILAFYNDVVLYLKTHKDYPGWSHGEYPFKDNINKALNEHSLYIGIENDVIISAVIVNTDYFIQYKDIDFYHLDNSYILHSFAVHPLYLQKGYAKKMLDFIVKKAVDDCKESICLDVYEHNVPAIKLYEKYGFIYRGKLSFGFEYLGLNYFNLYEKTLKNHL